MTAIPSSSPSSKSPARRPSARQARQRLRELAALVEAQAALGWVLILLLFALLGVLYLNQVSRTAGVGWQMQVLQRDLGDLKRENRELERQIAEAQSLTHLQREADRLGFSQAQPADIEYIVVPNYLVTTELAQTGMAEMETAVVPAPAATLTEALQLMVQQRLNSLITGEASE